MHVVMFGDQHVESLGGAQVSMRLQRRFLERAGHTVSIVAPRMHGPRAGIADDAYIDTPSIPLTVDREYSMSWPGRRTDRFVDAALSGRPPVDVVHVQGDFWGAFIGHRFAARHGLPVVHTMHNRVDVGIEATAPFPGVVLRSLNAWQRRVLAPVGRGAAAERDRTAASTGLDGWAYLRRFAARSQAVTAPSSHFARRLEQHGVTPGLGAVPGVDVVWNGIDDDVLDAALASEPARRAAGRPRLVWLGRMSPEKRLLPFLEAVAEAGIEAEVEIIGGGGQEGAARRLVQRLTPTASVVFAGRLPYVQTLHRIAAADAVVQTSIGFETQGMTVFEAAALGTPAVVSDPDIAAELGSGLWAVPDASSAALAATLRTAVTQIASGHGPIPDGSVRDRFRQSSRTAAMVEVYRRARA
ncbi:MULTISPECIES: glycosyltransferase [unclassified Microbacterium]|uniref:glycosyltransferase n=1 Tax=unclassified Microbacterium TaxID=2609290 RepID=UPI00214B306A|nr:MULTISPECIES: glycosyltransferase [unclassified Microbacterium]MCR2808437.1 glycosyltransferase [Microbacterium sp. zg.B185]WIM19119.1 glycosyltransferase [Microbacterium sp. zg-B185]